MKIIDNKKDYYDYLVSIYGIDEKMIYDRRGSTTIKDIQSYEIQEMIKKNSTELTYELIVGNKNMFLMNSKEMPYSYAAKLIIFG